MTMTSFNLEVGQCRTCINECIDYLSLYDIMEIESESITLADMLSYCTNVDVNQAEESILPLNVCKSCLNKLQISFFFKKMVLNSQEVLLQNVQMECHGEIAAPKHENLNEDYLMEQILETAEESARTATPQQQEVEDEINVIVDDDINEAKPQPVFQMQEAEEDHLDNIEEFELIEKTNEDYDVGESIIIEEVDNNEIDSNDDDEEEVLEIDEIKAVDSNDEDEENEGEDVENENRNPAKKLFTCEVCGRGFHHKSRLQTHLETHSDDKHFVCEFCGKTLKNNKSYKNHMSVHTDEKKYKCETCGRCFRSSSNLQVHNRIHTGERPFKCDQCEQAFVTHDMLKRHIYLHTGERPYACDKCDKKYRDLTNLKAHQRTHDESKMFECEICGLKLTQMAGYRKHKRVHDGDMPYKCDICERRFRFSSNLYAHVRLHSGEKPYKCTQCMKAFPTSKRLRLHSKVHDNNHQRAPRKQPDRRGAVRIPDMPDQKVVKSNVVLLY